MSPQPVVQSNVVGVGEVGNSCALASAAINNNANAVWLAIILIRYISFGGETFSPALRAWLSPIAIAWWGFVTFGPCFDPLCSLPAPNSRIVAATLPGLCGLPSG